MCQFHTFDPKTSKILLSGPKSVFPWKQHTESSRNRYSQLCLRSLHRSGRKTANGVISPQDRLLPLRSAIFTKKCYFRPFGPPTPRPLQTGQVLIGVASGAAVCFSCRNMQFPKKQVPCVQSHNGFAFPFPRRTWKCMFAGSHKTLLKHVSKLTIHHQVFGIHFLGQKSTFRAESGNSQ